MTKKKITEFWITDEITYNNLQKLKKFVEFVAGLEYSTEENKTKAKEIIYLIENIDKPETIKDWDIALELYDYHIQDREYKESFVYWRTWSVYFENESIEIEASSNRIGKTLNSEEKDFEFSGFIFFKKEINHDRIYMNKDIDEFIDDAMNYQKYITETLNDIEININIW
ncbi:MAG: hypothetical protein ACOYOV_02805 [Bacteroidales bacterium]